MLEAADTDPESATIQVLHCSRHHRTLAATFAMAIIFALSQANDRESKQRELANQRFAQALDSQVLLVNEIQTE